MSDYRIKRMSREEFKTAIDWAGMEGWNPGLHDLDCFYQTDPNGFFAGVLDGQIIAVGSAVCYDEHFAFCGFYIVSPKYRHQGYGLKLTQARLEYVGERNAGIDGVVDMLDKYERLGYRIAHNNARFGFKASSYPGWDDKHIVKAREADIKTLADYDSKHFAARRDKFIDCWINQPDSLSIVWREKNSIKGFAVIRSCVEGFKIGPLYADNPGIADALFKHLCHFSQSNRVYLDIPVNNVNAMDLVKRYDMEKVFETARMYLKEEPKLPINNIYGITSFELG